MTASRHVAAIVAALSIGIGVFLAFDPFSRSPAPNVAYTLLDGRTGTVEQLRGKVVLVNFWATDCPVCVNEMPQLAATHYKFQARGLETLAVALQADPPAEVLSFAQARGLPFGVAIDSGGAIANAFGDMRAAPVTLLLARQGTIVQRHIGAADFGALHATVERLLAQG